MQGRDHILKAMRAALEPKGFRARGINFHRHRIDGFIETVSLQAGTGHLAECDTVNLGIYIPEVAALLGDTESIAKARAKKYPKEYECVLRIRLSKLAFGEDRWFERIKPGVEKEIASLLASCAIPYFAQFTSLRAIADGIRAGRFPESVVRPGVQAAVFYLLGEEQQARSVLLRWREDNPALVERIAQSMGITL